MCQKFTADELNSMNHDTKNEIIYQMQDRLDKLEHDYENLIEQIRLANQQRYGRHTEKLDESSVSFPFSMKQKPAAMNRLPSPPLMKS